MPADPMQELIEAVESVPPYARLDLTGSKKAAFVALTLGEWEQVKAALLSRAEQAQGVEGWREIVSAPPGAYLLVCREAWSVARVGRFSHGSWWANGERLSGSPDYWRPLPPPPGSAATPKSAAGEGSNPDPKQRLSAAEQLFWAEVRSPASTRRSLAVCYALLVAYAAGCLRAGDPVGLEFWRPINAALNDRLGLDSNNKVDRFRKLVWDISSAACDVREAAMTPQTPPPAEFAGNGAAIRNGRPAPLGRAKTLTPLEPTNDA